MKLVPFTFNGGTLNNGSSLIAVLQTEGQLIPSTNIIEVSRTNNFPEYAGKEFESKYLPIVINMPANGSTLVDSVNEILDTTDTTERVFVCKDSANSSKEWYVNAVVQRQVDYGPTFAEYILYAADPVWRSVTGGSASIAATATPGTLSGTVDGNRIARPIITIKPTGAKTGSYAYKRFIEVYNPSTSQALTAYPVNLIDDGSGTAVWNSGTLVAGGTIESAAGYDVRVYVDNAEVPRWFGAFNTATTSVWSNVSLKPKVELTLRENLGTTSVSEILFVKNKANYKSLTKLPAAGVLRTSTGERIAYTDCQPKDYKIAGTITRATRNSSAGTVAKGGTVFWLEHDVYLLYGNSTATAPDQDDNYQPAITLVDSNNITHKWDTFGEGDGLRSLSWFPAVISSRGKESYTYGGNQGTADTDPFTDMGMAAKWYMYGNRAQSESCNLVWDLYHPVGGTQIIYNGEFYKATSSYPSYRRVMRAAANKTSYTQVTNLAAPTTAASWESFAGTTTFSGAYPKWRWQLQGGLAAITDNAAYLEVNDFTLSLSPTNRPVVTMASQEANYQLDLNIKNNTTGEAIDVKYTMAINKTLTLDCATNTATYDDGQPAASAVATNTSRDYWLHLDPGVNEIVITEEGLTGLTISLTWEERKL